MQLFVSTGKRNLRVFFIQHAQSPIYMFPNTMSFVIKNRYLNGKYTKGRKKRFKENQRRQEIALYK